MKVTIGGHDVELVAPASMATRMDIRNAAGDNWSRAFAAALAACWRGQGRPKTRYATSGYSALRFGGMVIDELAEQGIPYDEIMAAGAVAWRLCAADELSGSEVAELEAGFPE